MSALARVTLRGMPELSRLQVVVYGAIAIALLLVGARAIRADGAGEPSFAAGTSAQAGESDDGFSLRSGGADVVIDVTGAVRRPGVYRLPAGARVTDAIDRAGGASAGSELEAINLAARLADGQQVLVPSAGRDGVVAGGTGGEENGPISVGSATVEQLESIDGIGPVTAQKIIEYRDQKGGVASVDQLDEVSGIGPVTMESLRARLQP